MDEIKDLFRPRPYHNPRLHPYTPLTSTQRTFFIILGILLLPVGIGFTFLLVPFADHFKTKDQAQSMDYAKKILEGKAKDYNLGDVALKNALKSSQHPDSMV